MVNMKMARKHIESLYVGRCEIKEVRSVEDPETGITFSDEWHSVIMNQPCKLSTKTIAEASSEGSVAEVSKVVKLFLAPEIRVKEGSRITVAQHGTTEQYECSGTPAVYGNHQEIILRAVKKWV
jgi:hypothetical protein